MVGNRVYSVEKMQDDRLWKRRIDQLIMVESENAESQQ